MDDMPNYDEEAVKPMRDELVAVGFDELRTPDQVDQMVDEAAKTTLVVINSVCGCAAGGARPGVSLALQNTKIPDQLGTVFAGQDKRAVARFREKMSSFAPSSPFIALLKGGEPVKVMQRHDIEGKDANMIAGELRSAFEEHCERQGPSISPEEFAKITGVQACGSSIPRNTIQIEGMPQAGHRPEPNAPDEENKGSWWKLFK